MSPCLFDTHAHLSGVVIPADLQHPILNVTTSLNQWQSALDLSIHYANVLPALGIHPWFIQGDMLPDLVKLTYLLDNNRVAAIGEIGLDFFPEFLPFKAEQLVAFEMQVGLAQQHNLPLSLHCRKAFNEMLMRLKPLAMNKNASTLKIARGGIGVHWVKGVLHGFNGSEQLARQFREVNIHLGLGGLLLNPNANKLRATVKALPLESFVLESDFSSVSLKGKDLGLDQLSQVAEVVCEIKNIPYQVVLDTLYNTSNHIFGHSYE